MSEPNKPSSEQTAAPKSPHTYLDIDAEQRLNAILNAAVDALIIINQHGIIELFNTAAEKMFLYSSDKVLGQNIKMLMPSPFKQEHDGYLASYLTTGHAQIIGKGRKTLAQRSNLETFPIFLSIGEVLNSSHRQFVGIIRDISEQEKHRKEAEDNREKLSRASRLSVMGELTAGIAHEMNQPLSAIASYAQASKNLLQGASTDNHQKIITVQEKINQQTIRANNVISRLRQFVKTRVAKVERVNLIGLIKETIELANIDARILEHQVKVENENNLAFFVLADPIQIQQVLLNLIRNGIEAMDAMPGHPLIIKINLLKPETVEIKVIDTGQGIDEEMKHQLFNPFFSTKEHGMGMGLSISQTIVHAHGGNIYHKHNHPNGSIFGFSLPVYDSTQASLQHTLE
ncbi:ATP-binding protein [Aliiglaciecola sp. LCG003]|uniref:two-component system sensor histidine kinase NtrB n=1 Tax=Aliiglaciecola sp. LCG003 TaxID=3053655 RepID=UPI0025740186|nr:ATP-binding protein [Aliiglaciecola sp. LCG003]WJG07687.1 PAS domain S-box protein [Aliiglaciecola sp. LCG003]